MKKVILLIVLGFTCCLAQAQKEQYYTTSKGSKHLTGPFQLEILKTDSVYSQWFNSGYESYQLDESPTNWVKNLKGLEVDIYLGTWCGDSKNWVPKFVKTWDELGLKGKDLSFTALYGYVDGETLYKQGPNGEEVGKNIHRVPTFIFKKDGKEIARIVETPVNDLTTDLAQIALGFPSNPNYRGASYLLDLFEKEDMDSILANQSEHYYEVYELINQNPYELNTLGNVLLESDRLEEALMVFYFNSLYFRYNPRMLNSYGKALAANGQKEEAYEQYEKVLLMDRSNEDAKEGIKKLRGN